MFPRIAQTLGLLFRYFLKPLSMQGLALLYYILYCFWSLVKQFYVLLGNLSSGKAQDYWFQKASSVPLPPSDVYAQALDIVARHGYHLEIHTIRTDDNYLLKAWRLNKNPLQLTRPYPIMIQHGLIDCSWSWFLNDDKKTALPYILCEEGYDVWMMNNRGNKYSIGHTDFEDCAKNLQYWDFSFDEIVKYDVPAIVEHVKKTSGKEKVIYIGHSQGSTQIFGQICQNPDFQNNLRCFVALGPAVFVSNQKSKIVRWIVKLKLMDMLYWMRHPSFFCFDDTDQVHIGALCYMFEAVFLRGFFGVVNLLCGYPEKNKINLDRFGIMVSFEPGGASTKNVYHWIQFIRRKQFSYFDYGSKGNLERYGQPEPPAYQVENLKKFKIPKYLLIGEKDIICDEKDIQSMVKLLDNQDLIVEELKDYAHLDYVWAVDAHEKVYGKILKYINQYS